MEFDNYQRGLNSKNHPGVLPSLAQEMADNNLNYNNKGDVLDFIRKKTQSLNLNPEKEIIKIQSNWEKIETESIKRMVALFG